MNSGRFFCRFTFFSYLCSQNMKQTRWILVACAGIMMLGACKEKAVPKDTAEYADSYVIPKPGDPIKMGAVNKEIQARWNGEPCVVKIRSIVADSLPMVENEYGQKYVDNVFDVQVVGADQSSLFHRTLRKSQFVGFIKDSKVQSEYGKKAILKSVSAELAENTKELRYFVASLQVPEAAEDEYLLFKYATSGDIEQVDEDIRVNWQGQPAPVPEDDEEWTEE